MEVRKGYKQTEVGVIPEDWDTIALGDCVAIRSGQSPSSFTFGSEGVPYFKVDQLNIDIKFQKNTPYFVVQNNRNKNIHAPKNSIIFPKRGASILLNKMKISWRDAYLDTNMMSLECIRNLYHEFLYYQLCFYGLDQVADTTSIPQINNKHIIPFVVPFPLFHEQKAIAAALSDVDALIQNLEKLTTKKRAIKTATMQQLLTGKKRLPGFDGEWSKVVFGQVVKIRRESVSNIDIGKLCIELEHISKATGVLIGKTALQKGASSKIKFHENDVLFGKLRSYLRKYWLSNVEGVCTSEIWPLVVDSLNIIPKYLFQIVQQERFIEASSISYGTHMPRSDWKAISELEYLIPPILEQEKIADLLSNMDVEIHNLEKKLKKTKAIKQGMMQELLTGRTRLV